MYLVVRCKRCKNYYNYSCDRKFIIKKFFGLVKKTHKVDWCSEGIYDYNWKKNLRRRKGLK